MLKPQPAALAERIGRVTDVPIVAWKNCCCRYSKMLSSLSRNCLKANLSSRTGSAVARFFSSEASFDISGSFLVRREHDRHTN